MRIIKSLIVTLLLCLCASASAQQQMSEAVAFAQTLGVGWNLGNNLDAHVDGVSVETSWGNQPATQKTFDAVKKAGFGSVRIPVTWMGHIDSGNRIEKAWMDRVAEVVGYAKKAGLKCIVNIHHDGFGAQPEASEKGCFWLDIQAAAKDDAKNTAIKQKLAMVWAQIASRFAAEGDWLIFETMNEIQDGYWGNGDNLKDGGRMYAILNEWNQLCVDVIRSTGGNNETRYIGIPSFVCQPWMAVRYLRLPKDSVKGRLMVAVHMYDPWDYAGSGKYNEWGHTGKNVVPDGAGEEEYVNTLEFLYKRFVSHGVPVYLGEYGCVRRSTPHAEAFRKYYLEYTCKALGDRHIPLFFWDNGYNKVGDDAFGLINHATGKYIGADSKPAIDIMVKAWHDKSPEYTLESIYERAPQAK